MSNSRWWQRLLANVRIRPGYAARRVAMTVRCRDTDAIPKVADAGRVIDHQSWRVQVMHEGTLVVAGCYDGEWTTPIVRKLRGHHEPQEELVFHHLLHACRPGTLMIEVGAFWAYYTNWWLGAVPGSRAVCVEPDANNLAVGQRNLAINGRTATWVRASVGKAAAPATSFVQYSDKAAVSVPCHSLESLLDSLGRPAVEMLHLDCQGAEFPFLGSIDRAAEEGLLRFVVVSTHHESISGSPTTHGDCVRLLQDRGAAILCEHTIDESFSGDGLVVASFRPADAAIPVPAISRNTPRKALFKPETIRGRRLALTDTDNGPMVVRRDDAVIGRALRHRGAFEEAAVRDVVGFLMPKYAFRPTLLVDVGANIGTHLLRGLNDGLFPRGIGIEMDADNFRLLGCNLALNGHGDRTRLWNVAVSDVPGSAKMEVSPDNLGDHRVLIGDGQDRADRDGFGEARWATRTVPVTTLDAIEAESGIAFDDGTLVWIDVQGHEGHVVAGAEGILGRERRPVFVLEFWPYGLDRAGGLERLLRFLRRCRAIHDIRVPEWRTTAPVDVAALEALYHRVLRDEATRRSFHTDLLCIS